MSLFQSKHVFNFGQCKATMNVYVDPRDNQIFVTDECLDAMKTLAGSIAAPRASSASVVVDGRTLNLVNGARYVNPVLPTFAGDKLSPTWMNASHAEKVISITRGYPLRVDK